MVSYGVTQTMMGEVASQGQRDIPMTMSLCSDFLPSLEVEAVIHHFVQEPEH